jgi:hypothetical protein
MSVSFGGVDDIRVRTGGNLLLHFSRSDKKHY